MDITTLSVQELKALVYDESVRIEQSQNNVRIINAEIAKRNETMSASSPIEPADFKEAAEEEPAE